MIEYARIGMTPKEILDRIPGLTRDQLAYYTKSGYVRPQKIRRGKNEYSEYSDDDFVVIRSAFDYIHRFETTPKNAFSKAKDALSEPELAFNRK